MDVVLLDCAAKVLYFLGFAIFKGTAGRMDRLSANHPLHVTVQLCRSPRWLSGLAVVLAGLAAESYALTELPLAAAVPVSGSTLIVVVLISVALFRERIGPLEWLALAATAVALAILALSAGLLTGSGALIDVFTGRLGSSFAPAVAAAPVWRIAVLVVPSVLIPTWVFCVRDRDVASRHSRALTGVAYGVGAGALFGAAEVSGAAVVELIRAHRPELWASPHPYVVLVAGGLGLGLLQIGLQRCRLSIVVTVVTVAAKIDLLLAGCLLFGEPWPAGLPQLGLRIAGMVLAVIALLMFPRYERSVAHPDEPRPAAPVPLSELPVLATPHRSFTPHGHAMPLGPAVSPMLSAPPMPPGHPAGDQRPGRRNPRGR